MDRSISRSHRLLLVVGFGIASATGVASAQAQELCGGADYPFPYTDVSGVGAAFCPGIMEAYVTGVSKGTAPTTFSPNETVTRVQMTTFLQRSLDQGLRRNSLRASAEQWWLPSLDASQVVDMGGVAPVLCKPDRDSIWVAAGNTVVHVAASTGAVLGTWTGVTNAFGVLVGEGVVYVTGSTSPGVIYKIDPVSGLISSANVNPFPRGIAFDGTNIWTANGDGSVSIYAVAAESLLTVTGFTLPYGLVYDGSNIWVTDLGANNLYKLDGSGNIVQTVSTGAGPAFPVFDGANIWVPNANDSTVTVVQASTGAIVATLTGGGLSNPATAAFDGERILVTNQQSGTVTLYKAADLSFIGNVQLRASTDRPYGACSDGLNFWVTLNNNTVIVRF
jgi:hypothetical protein